MIRSKTILPIRYTVANYFSFSMAEGFESETWLTQTMSRKHWLDKSSFVVLIVDDDPFFVEAITLQFASLGIHNVLSARNGEEALDLLHLRSGDVDLIVCDVFMPETDGFYVLDHVKDTGFSGSLLFISGADAEVFPVLNLMGAANQVKIAGTLKKPVSMQQLSAAI